MLLSTNTNGSRFFNNKRRVEFFRQHQNHQYGILYHKTKIPKIFNTLNSLQTITQKIKKEISCLIVPLKRERICAKQKFSHA